MQGEVEVVYVEVPGASLWTASQGRGTPLVLCHGGPGMSDNLGPVGAMVDDLARVHRFDQRGGGRSSVAGPLDVDALVADLDGLREHWEHDRWIVAGHSWGAALSLFYALKHPDRTLGVIYLAGTAVRWGFQAAVQAARLGRLSNNERAELERLSDRLAEHEHPADRARFLRLLWSTDFACREAAAVLDEAPLYEFPRSEEAARAIQSSWRARLEGDFIAELSQLEVPVLVLHGEHDPDPTGAREVAGLVPEGRWITIRDAGHTPWLEKPEPLRTALRDFVRHVAPT